MLLIGSRALVANNPELIDTRKCVDWDYICTIEQFSAWHKANKANLQFAVPTQQGKYYHARDKDGMNYEFELAWPGTSAEMLLKMYPSQAVRYINSAFATARLEQKIDTKADRIVKELRIGDLTKAEVLMTLDRVKSQF